MLTKLMDTKQVNNAVKQLRKGDYLVHKTKETVECNVDRTKVFWAVKNSSGLWLCRLHEDVFTFDNS